MRVGAPSKYLPEYCEFAEMILGNDEPWCALASALGVHEETLDKWKRKYPDFADACARGRATGKTLFLKKVNEAAWDPKTKPVNNTLVSLLAVNMYKMTTARRDDKQDMNVKGTLSLADAIRQRDREDPGE